MTDNSKEIARQTRRYFFGSAGFGLGSIALGSLVGSRADAASNPLAVKPTHFPAKAKRVIYLFMAGGPSQLELFDDKPKLKSLDGQVVPPTYTANKRFAFIKQDAKLLASRRRFARHGQSGATVSELLPNLAGIADNLTFVKSMKTDVFNHGPAKILMNTGSPQFGRPSMGAWVSYGIGSESENLPGFIVLNSGPRGPRGGTPLYGSGFLPSAYQGVTLRGDKVPILNLASPAGMDNLRQKSTIDAIVRLNRARQQQTGDAEIETRIAAYEMAFRMQTSAPDLVDLSGESRQTLALYGVEANKPSFARNCLLARRMVERGVRFVQLYHTDWDHHGNPGLDLGGGLEKLCREVDQASAALVLDLKSRGLLEETLVIWGGEFGRTPMGEARDTLGRDHHVENFTIWLAGGGVRPGITLGATDDLGYYVTQDPVHVHDLQATVLHLLGIDHKRLTYRFQGRDFRLTDVAGNVVTGLLA